jgi:maltokinase
VLDVVPLRPSLSLALVEARFHSGQHDLYQLLVGPKGKEEIDGGVFDALSAPREAAVLVDLMQRSTSVEGVEGSVNFYWTGTLPPLDGQPDVRPMGVEQSNSTIVLDETMALKVFRRLLPGDNPELEMLRFLSSHGFENIAPLAGWYEFAGERLQATLGILQRYVSGGREAWEFAITEPDAFLARVGELAEVTGRMHTVLASDLSDPDFAPEVPSDEQLGLLTATIDEEIERVFRDLDPDDERVAPIAGRSQELRERLQLLSHQSTGGRLIRHHGDYHLGQVLIAPEGFVILDFEGEPARALVERRRKRSPLRDVAGMLRSFAYAAIEGNTDDTWQATARERFLTTYMQTVDPNLLPAGQVSIQKLLAIFELEKAIYELRYELNNRPDWVGIPVAAIERLLDAPLD